ncbi:Pheromone/general odorant binding protein [Cinara cedri]|uniref:Pheromone/general odorant binding protein n=1 Tax=Cinara cedri TaxID=506608 RepID=A0A5E4MG86_9HEMI|nr:Pheromone/general odorant binding protein [Cinara cedri]
MDILPVAVFLAVSLTILTDCNAYLSEAAIKKTQKMLKSVCSKKFPVSDETLTKVKEGEFPDDNDNLKCYFGCTLKTMQMVNSKGFIEKKLFKDKMTMLAPPNILEILIPPIEECTEKDQDELCQSAFNLFKCMYGVDPKCLDYLPV